MEALDPSYYKEKQSIGEKTDGLEATEKNVLENDLEESDGNKETSSLNGMDLSERNRNDEQQMEGDMATAQDETDSVSEIERNDTDQDLQEHFDKIGVASDVGQDGKEETHNEDIQNLENTDENDVSGQVSVKEASNEESKDTNILKDEISGQTETSKDAEKSAQSESEGGNGNLDTDATSEGALESSSRIDDPNGVESDEEKIVEDIPDPADFSTFDERTALNYFHLHKTGGVSFKERMFDFFHLHVKINKRGRKAIIADTCHISGDARPALGIEAQWSCDWGKIEKLPEVERNKIDVVVGHQYWERGAGYWLPNRDLRCFTVMRHPLHRKVSFFYHFFVRNAGRSEESVSKDELIQFILGKKMPESPLIRDAGPGYYASRLWSDGVMGFTDNSYEIGEETVSTMIQNSIRRLHRNFVFVGLQTQEAASLCMLKRTVHELAKAHGFSNMDGLDELDKKRERLNTGSYPLSGIKIWEAMNQDQKEEFKRVEKVDLEIYRESVKMFHEMAKRFECAHLVEEKKGDDIAL